MVEPALWPMTLAEWEVWRCWGPERFLMTPSAKRKLSYLIKSWALYIREMDFHNIHIPVVNHVIT